MQADIQANKIMEIINKIATELKESIKKTNTSNKSMLRCNIEKENAIMSYELKICKKVFEMMNVDQSLYKQAELQVQLEALHHNYKILQEKYCEQEKIRQNFQQKNKKTQKNMMQQQANLQILQKKCNQFDKIGGLPKYRSLEQKIKNLQKIINEKDNEIQHKDKQIKSLKQKVRILTELNAETEDKLAEEMISRTDKQNNCMTANTTKQNSQQTKQRANKSSAIDCMAQKQQIKELKHKIEQSQQQKKLLKKKYEQMQKFYSKMLTKC